MTLRCKPQAHLAVASEITSGAAFSSALEYSDLWRARDGNIPPLDDPTLQFSAQRSEKPSVLHLQTIVNRVSAGQIGPPDLILTKFFQEWICLTERQIRRLAANSFDKAHHIGTRLRILQKLDWFDGYWFSRQGVLEKEHVWMLGQGAFIFYTMMHGMHLLEPWQLHKYKSYSLSICAINELRMILEERGKYAEVVYAPNWSKGDPIRPFSQFFIQSEKGPLTMYVERLAQKSNPLRLMQKKQEMYEKMVADNAGKLPMVQPGAAMVVWSVGSLEAIEALVGSIDYMSDAFVQIFLPDECLDEFPRSFFVAKKGKREGEVELQRLNMDIL
ncbi:hypothetical protein PAECIP111802_04905 [Paenibacillus allorhizosphaerae]|uniref:Uncharacterized protein n=1 Tax=Paenibacillus allorhizosphaerae TaxID=2849866 RepID=A0ABM8VNB2_9BACL|nr:hypothetical protein PAECIP111802_04905 [Paenibacillus allorhizosphaerae]